MNLHTKKHICETVNIRWARQYPPNNCDIDKKNILDKLKSLNPPTEKEIVKIIGNTSWTENMCNECGKDSDVTIWIGGYKELSESIKICPSCLKKLYSDFFDKNLF